MNKQELRQKYLSLRKAISSKEKLKLDDMLLLQFQQLDFTGIETVMTYWGMQKNNEPNTHLFSSYLRHVIPELQLAYPVTDFGNNNMKAILIDEDTVYRTNEYGITEPKEGKEINANKIDLVLVPLIVCDNDGYRVGYGKGFYDRFLANCNPNVVTMGLNYFDPVEIIDDIDEFDIPLCYCITPNTTYEF